MKINKKYINLFSKNTESSDNDISSFTLKHSLQTSKSSRMISSAKSSSKSSFHIASVLNRYKQKQIRPLYQIRNYSNKVAYSNSCTNKQYGSIKNDFFDLSHKHKSCNKIIKLKTQYLKLNLPLRETHSKSQTDIFKVSRNKTPLIRKRNILQEIENKRHKSLKEEDTLYNHFSKSFSSKLIKDNLRQSIDTVLSSSLSSLLSKKNNKDIINKEMTVTHLLTSFQFSLSLKVLELPLEEYSPCSCSSDKTIKGYIKGFAGNSYKGLYPKHNYNKIRIVLKIEKPKIDTKWPDISIFSLYDGFYGKQCVDYVFDNLHQNILKSQMFVKNYASGINEGYSKTQNDYMLKMSKRRKIQDKSGCCSIDIFIIDSVMYVVNLGDSKVLVSRNNFEKEEQLTTPHDITNIFEKSRILREGGRFLTGRMNQYLIPKNLGLNLPFCEFVKPGNFRMTRAFGVVESKLAHPHLILNSPDINSFVIEKDLDFIFVGNKEIFRNLSNKEVFECIKMVFASLCEHNEYNCQKCIHKKCANVIDIIIKSAQFRGGFGNLSAYFILFNENLGFIVDNSNEE